MMVVGLPLLGQVAAIPCATAFQIVDVNIAVAVITLSFKLRFLREPKMSSFIVTYDLDSTPQLM